MRLQLQTLALCISLAALAACGDDKKDSGGGGGTKKDDGGKAAETGGGGGAAYDKAKGTASIRVTVKSGLAAVPAGEMYKMPSSDSCNAHSDKIAKETKEVNANGTVPWAFCFVDANSAPIKGMTGFDKSGAKTLDQKDCVYRPHVLGCLVGQDVIFKNSDPTGHNVHAKPSKNDEKNYNKTQSPGKSDTVQFPKAEEAIPVNCDVHSWMRSYIFVQKNPFFDVSARETGVATISGLYPGKYTLKVWHETYAATATTMDVEVKDGETKDVTVTIGK